IKWDERMLARKTASYGKAYNYSQINYDETPFPDELTPLIHQLKNQLNFQPNNCLINYYENGKSRMGWHSDQIDILETDTGIAIISLGAERILKFRNIRDKNQTREYFLNSGSLIYMNQNVQKLWQHSIPKCDVENGRLSLSFRKIL
ncbi:alpha-ketoglutarate-dependent dioxygenase AlkB, partial [Acinetobacter stercoris]